MCNRIGAILVYPNGLKIGAWILTLFNRIRAISLFNWCIDYHRHSLTLIQSNWCSY